MRWFQTFLAGSVYAQIRRIEEQQQGGIRSAFEELDKRMIRHFEEWTTSTDKKFPFPLPPSSTN